MNKKLSLVVKLVIILIPICILGWVLNKQFSPLGRLVLTKDFKGDSPFISDLYPQIRVGDIQKEDGINYQIVEDDAVYFDLELPRWYDTATFNIKYKTTSPIFKISGRRDKDEWLFLEKSLANKLIDSALNNDEWDQIEQDDLILLAKDGEYSTIQNFIDKPPEIKKVATYFYNDLSKNTYLSDYQKSDDVLEINKTLRGSHNIYTYIKNEELDFSFDQQDLNRAEGKDELNINVYERSTERNVYSQLIEDDAVDLDSDQISDAKQVSINIPDLAEGIYRIELSTTDDLLISNIKTKQSKVIFGQKIFIADSPEYLNDSVTQNYSTNIYSSGEKLTILTVHPDSFQTLSVNNTPLDINAINKKYILGKNELTSEGLDLINSPKSDLLIESDGYFSFSLDAFFFPKPTNIAKFDYDTKLAETDYIIAKGYTSPEKNENGWYTSRTQFDLDKLYKDEDSKIQFLLSTPGLKDNEGKMQIAEIKVTLGKPPLTIDNFTTRLNNFIKKIKSSD